MADNTKQDLMKVKDTTTIFDCPRCGKIDLKKDTRTYGYLICYPCYKKIDIREIREKMSYPSYSPYFNAYVNKMRNLRLAKKKGITKERKQAYLDRAEKYSLIADKYRPLYEYERKHGIKK